MEKLIWLVFTTFNALKNFQLKKSQNKANLQIYEVSCESLDFIPYFSTIIPVWIIAEVLTVIQALFLKVKTQ